MSTSGPLDRMMTGDAVAVEQCFTRYEPYLRMVVRRQLAGGMRAKFDSQDVVQSVWAHLLKGLRESDRRFNDSDHLRAFLVRLTRHRFIDRLRLHRRAVETEQPLDEHDRATAGAA